ncbi:Rhodanese-like domain-containing protein [Haematococcus lacustris]
MYTHTCTHTHPAIDPAIPSYTQLPIPIPSYPAPSSATEVFGSYCKVAMHSFTLQLQRRLPVRSIQKCGSLASGGAAPRRVQTHQALIGRQQPAAPRSAESNVPDDLLEHLAATPGVRVVVPGQGNELLKEEDDDDDDAWDEVMAELSDPWMAEPPPAHDELAPFNGTVPAPLSSLPPGSLEAPGGAVAAAEVVVLKEVEEVLALQQAQGTQLVLLDVRSEQEWETGHVPGSSHLPIKQLTGQAAAELAAQPVLVWGTGDYRGSQACVRLTRVYSAQHVWFFEGGVMAWEAGRGPVERGAI